MDEVIRIKKRCEAKGTFVAQERFSPAEIFRGVYADMPEHLRRQRQEMGY